MSRTQGTAPGRQPQGRREHPPPACSGRDKESRAGRRGKTVLEGKKSKTVFEGKERRI